ncbi:ATP phosphoribosyltransferase [Parvibaculum sp.]|uniref:ATP phosphoribosyltransferase n=1 Tax=Parvibaculum sp. TaxID=2024848 RepID=UPI0025ECEB5E|nr:ATP phosphoribosyltransferase [Parvibaculum sp.]
MSRQMKDALVIGIPSKGRLQENANAFFARAGLNVKQAAGGREYVGRLSGVSGVAVAFLSASEIVSRLEDGSIHFGVTGEDLIREQLPDADNIVELVLPLGFGYADVIVAVPQSWIDVETMADLDDVALAFHRRHGRRLRIATKYLNLTRGFFAEHGIADYRIVESAGATEGAPAAGTAEAIVDITTTGSTLAANNLKILDDGVMLKSQANLVASLRADWSAGALKAASAMLDRIDAKLAAETQVVVTARGKVNRAKLTKELAAEFGCTAEPGDGALSVLCPREHLQAVATRLREGGADAVTVAAAEYIFRARNELLTRLRKRLRK